MAGAKQEARVKKVMAGKQREKAAGRQWDLFVAPTREDEHKAHCKMQCWFLSL